METCQRQTGPRPRSRRRLPVPLLPGLLAAALSLGAASAAALTSPAHEDDGASVAAAVTGTQVRRDRPYVPAYLPELVVRPAAGPIAVDGVLDDPGWRGAAVADNFAEHQPGDQTEPEVDTEVLVTYDERNLYVAWICYDDPADVRATFGQRDNCWRDDNVVLALDTFGGGAVGYEISANAYGIQGDLLYSMGNGEDESYDMLYESAGRLTPYGYVIEMAIPFAELRFPGTEEQVWRVDFWRNRPRASRFQQSWAAYDRNESCWPCQWGTLRGIRGIEPSSGLEFLPSAVLTQSGYRDDNGDWRNRDMRWNPFAGERNLDLGLGVSYDLSSEITAEATVNPDFSQVESDAAQIDVNTNFALFYPERRPFFMEGSDLFSSPFNAVYTRSINDPLAAAKLTGRKGKTSVAFLGARDEHSVIILPFEESSEFVLNGRSVTNVLRLRRDLGDQTYLGAVLTDRRFDGGGAGSLGGLDGRVRLSANDAFAMQVLATRTEEVDNPALTADWGDTVTFERGKHTSQLDGESYWGHGLYAAYAREQRNFWFGLNYWEKSPTFRADVGFEPSNDYRLSEAEIGNHFRFEDRDGLLERISPSLQVARKWNFDGVRKDEWLMADLGVYLRLAQTALHLQYLRSNELYHGIQFDDIWQSHLCLSSQPGLWLRFGGNVNHGHRIARRDEVMGRETSWGAWCDLQPVDRLLLGTRVSGIRSEDLETGRELFSDFIARTEFGYQASRELSLRLILQYRDRQGLWEADPLLTYRLNPLSTFYLGSTRDYQDLDPQPNGAEGWRLTDRQYFMKLQYLFRA